MNKRRGQASVANWILYAILLILLIAVMPGFISLNNAAVGQIDIQNPAFIVASMIPLIFFAFFLFKGLPFNSGG